MFAGVHGCAHGCSRVVTGRDPAVMYAIHGHDGAVTDVQYDGIKIMRCVGATGGSSGGGDGCFMLMGLPDLLRVD